MVGLTVKYELFVDSVRLPVKLTPVTVRLLLTALFIAVVPKLKDVTLGVISAHFPLTLTVLLVASPPLMVMVPECEPAAVGL